MTRILVISDIHANLTALEAVLSAAGAVDATWCLGDLVGYGPDPNECVKCIRAIPNLTCLLGNHDAAALGQLDLDAFNHDAKASACWMQEVLSVESKEFLLSLPQRTRALESTLVHGSPRNPVWEYLLDIYTVEQNFACFEDQLCFAGHTHLPVAYLAAKDEREISWKMLREGDNLRLKHRAILNPGSVGQPRDHDPRASYAILDPEAKSWTNFRVTYDIASVQTRILQAGLPYAHAARLSGGW